MLKVPIDWLSDWLIDWFFSLIIHAFTDILLNHSIMDSPPCFQRHKTEKTFPSYLCLVAPSLSILEVGKDMVLLTLR